jgi:hypothetical protein
MTMSWSDLPASLKAERHGAVAVLRLQSRAKRNALDDFEINAVGDLTDFARADMGGQR